MRKPMIIKMGDYRIHPRYSNYYKSNYVENFNFQLNMEDNKVDFKLLIFTDNKTHKKTYVLVDVKKLKRFRKYKKCKKENKRLFTINVNEARKYEADEEKKAGLKSLCDVAVKYNNQVSLKKDEYIENIEEGNNEYIFTKDNGISFHPLVSEYDLSGVSEWKRRLVRAHYTKERNPRIRKEKIAAVKRQHNGKLVCEICKTVQNDKRYPKFYEERIFEVHHIKPLSELKEGDKTKLKDLAVLCANCHRAVHANAEVKENFQKLKKHFK